MRLGSIDVRGVPAELRALSLIVCKLWRHLAARLGEYRRWEVLLTAFALLILRVTEAQPSPFERNIPILVEMCALVTRSQLLLSEGSGLPLAGDILLTVCAFFHLERAHVLMLTGSTCVDLEASCPRVQPFAGPAIKGDTWRLLLSEAS